MRYWREQTYPTMYERVDTQLLRMCNPVSEIKSGKPIVKMCVMRMWCEVGKVVSAELDEVEELEKSSR